MTVPISGNVPSGSAAAAAAAPIRPNPAPVKEPIHKRPQPVDTVELSDSDRAEVLKLSGDTVKEIAGSLGLSEQAVETILSPPRIDFPTVK